MLLVEKWVVVLFRFTQGHRKQEWARQKEMDERVDTEIHVYKWIVFGDHPYFAHNSTQLGSVVKQ